MEVKNFGNTLYLNTFQPKQCENDEIEDFKNNLTMNGIEFREGKYDTFRMEDGRMRRVQALILSNESISAYRIIK